MACDYLAIHLIDAQMEASLRFGGDRLHGLSHLVWMYDRPQADTRHRAVYRHVSKALWDCIDDQGLRSGVTDYIVAHVAEWERNSI